MEERPQKLTILKRNGFGLLQFHKTFLKMAKKKKEANFNIFLL
jgi:hypothetical protein